MTTFAPRTLRLAAISFDRFRTQKNNLTPDERRELIQLADLLRAVARRDGDLLISAVDPHKSPPWTEAGEREPGFMGVGPAPEDAGVGAGVDTQCRNGRPQGPTPASQDRAFAAEVRVERMFDDAYLYAEGMEPFARGEGNLS